MPELLTSLDTPAGALLLAAIAFGDTLVGIGFFVFGELAFLVAGAAISTNGAYLPAVVVLGAAWAGDVTSYFIGSTYGPRIARPFLKRSRRRKAWRRAQAELARRGALFVVMSRFLGPVAWVTPLLAGTMGMPRRTFLPAAALGVLLGVGQFIVYGALGAQMIDVILPFIANHFAVILLAACMVLAGFLVWRRSDHALWVKFLQAVVMATSVFVASNLAYFFVLNSHPAAITPRPAFQDACDATSGPFAAEPGETSMHLPQPVNVILLSDGSGAALMAALGWHHNVTFTHNDIGFAAYLRLLFQNTPPISELYLNGIPADSAHQMPGTLKVREHIRWWDMGGGVHFGAVSKTEEIAIKYYRHLPVLLHDIDPKVDESRGLLALQVASLPSYHVVGLARLKPAVPDGIVADYETDGAILVVAKDLSAMPPHIRQCLSIDGRN